MGYVRTAGMSTAARRARRRALLVILTLLLGLAVAFAFSFAYMRGWVGAADGEADDTAITATAVPPPLQPDDITMNVYNSTSRVGLAGRAGGTLRELGFNVEMITDDPERAEIEGPGVIRHGSSGVEAATLLAETLLPQDVELVDDGREADTIDLVLGQAWEDLNGTEGEDR